MYTIKDTTKNHLHDRVDKLLKNRTLLNKLDRDKDSLRINRDKINDPSLNISRFPHTLHLQHHPQHIDYLYKYKLKECKFLCC